MNEKELALSNSAIDVKCHLEHFLYDVKESYWDEQCRKTSLGLFINWYSMFKNEEKYVDARTNAKIGIILSIKK